MGSILQVISPSLAIIATTCSIASAQNIVIQQPVIQQFGVATSVVVPDRGTALLGRISSAAISNNRPRFAPFSSAMGLQTNSASAAVSAFIHDFDELDRETLRIGNQALESHALARSVMIARTRPEFVNQVGPFSRLQAEQQASDRRRQALQILRHHR